MGKKTNEIIVRLDNDEFNRVTRCFEQQSKLTALAAFAREKLVAACDPNSSPSESGFNAELFKRQILFVVTVLHPELGPDDIETLYRENVECPSREAAIPEFVQNLFSKDGVA